MLDEVLLQLPITAFLRLKSKFQAVFGLYKDFAGAGRLCSTINYYFDREGTSRKYFQKDLPRGLAMLASAKEAKHIVITESPIDALSHRQLQCQQAAQAVASERQKRLEETMYLATCGSLSVGIQQELAQVFEQAKAKSQQVVLALDNDRAGKQMASQLEALLQEKQCHYRVELPELGKDWNESLML